MEVTFSFSGINWISVLVAAIVAFAIGGLWYSPLLFSKLWQTELKLKDEEIKKANIPLIFSTTFFLNLISAVALKVLLGNDSTLLIGLTSGLVVSVAWISTSLGINYLFSGKSFRLFLIDAGYFIVFFTVMGAILGSW